MNNLFLTYTNKSVTRRQTGMRKNTFRLVLLIFISFCGAALNSAEINQTNNRAVSRKFSETDELIYEYLVKNQNIFYD